jgi:2-polyprenyl-6-methoxyphenol hydroxylase-like FAD-dependent oxidoreductase
MGADRVVVIGAGVSGLIAALAMSRNGAEVVVVDRDDPPPSSLREPQDAFAEWPRAQVVQGRQPHNFLARTVVQLRQHAPDVLDMLAEHGVVPDPGPMALIPDHERVAGDEDIAWLPTRRLVFELLLRRYVEQQPGVQLRSRATVRGLSSTQDGAAAQPRLRGVVLDDGTAVAADWVVDASGRRGGMRDLLDETGAAPVPRRSQPCGLTYYSRHFRLLDETPAWMAGGIRTDEPPLYYAGFAGDARTICILLAPPTWDRELRALRDTGCWDAVARSLPVVAPWLDAARTEPISDVLAMAGHHNVLHELLVDGRPPALGYLPIGDALCITDPIYAWGASLAVTQAFAAAAALARHDDPGDVVCDYADAVMPEARIAYDLSASLDRIRDARLRGVEPAAVTGLDLEREALMREGIHHGMLGDTTLFRAYLRWLNMLDPVDAIYTDSDVVRRARPHQESYRANPPAAAAPPRDELLRLMQPARV